MERNESRERVELPFCGQPEGDGLVGGRNHHLLAAANAETTLLCNVESALAAAKRPV